MVVLLEDTRQQAGKHTAKHGWWDAHEVALVRSKLAFGDYCLPPKVAVDTKASIAELAYDIDHDHARFRRELVGAKDAGVALVVLVENSEGVSDLVSLSHWIEKREDFAKRKFAVRRLVGERLAKACVTMQNRYGCRFLFCRPDESAALVTRILCGAERGECSDKAG